MKVILNNITGIDDAIETMYLSKRTWTEDLHNEIKEVCDALLLRNGTLARPEIKSLNDNYYQQFNKWLDMVCKICVHHITLGRFIDFSFTVVGLHRGGQD